MTPHRTPGPMCVERQPFWMDDGTMCRLCSSVPTPNGHERFPIDEPVLLAEPDQVCGPANAEDEEILRKVRRMRKWAKGLGFDEAVAALDHYLRGTGEFVEIPAKKVENVRSESEDAHRRQFLKAVKGHFGAEHVGSCGTR